MNDIEKFIKNLDPSVIGKLKSFSGTPEGKKIVSRFSSLNKDELIKTVSSMSEEEKNSLLSKIPVNSTASMNKK